MKNNYIKRKKNQGFTLMEVIVVLGIALMGILGISSLMIQNMQVQNVNQRYLLASMLAQEGLELVRSKRDTNWITPGNEWNIGNGVLGNSLDIIQDGTYSIDFYGDINAAADDIADAGAKLYLDDDNMYFHNFAGMATTTPFFRLITVDGAADPTSASTTVSCHVQWRDHFGEHDYIADTVLYNWR